VTRLRRAPPHFRQRRFECSTFGGISREASAMVSSPMMTGCQWSVSSLAGDDRR
jgi:hypothetical protein